MGVVLPRIPSIVPPLHRDARRRVRSRCIAPPLRSVLGSALFSLTEHPRILGL